MSTSEDMKKAAHLIAKAKKIVVFTGAGVSADSNIATFRTDNGFWNGLKGKFALAYFGTPFGWNWTPHYAWKSYVSEFYAPIANAEPNAGHFALTTLQKAKSTSFITMNVDGLHQKAGSTDVSEVHGTVMKHSCIKNQHHMDIDIDITDLNDIKVPLCEIEGCGSSARPNCTLFTESLPSAQWQSAYAKCCLLRPNDVCIVVGTSSLVNPAATLPNRAKQSGATVIEFNLEETNFSQNVSDLVILGKSAETLPKVINHVIELMKLADEEGTTEGRIVERE